MFSRGTKTPQVLLLSKERREPASLGVLFRFQPDSRYSSVFEILDLVGNPLPKTPVSRLLP
jgi:hypothetical protein